MPPTGRHKKLASTAISSSLDGILNGLEGEVHVQQLIAHYQRRFRVPEQEMHFFVAHFKQLCVERMAQGEDTLVAKLVRLQQDFARAKEDFRKKLVHCNLNALRQLDLAKGGTGAWDDNITFYEPMSHLNEDEREMVFMVVKDKLRQVLDGNAPDSFMANLRESLGFWDPSKLLRKEAPVEEEEEDDFVEDAVSIARVAAQKSQEAAMVARQEAQLLQTKVVQISADFEQRVALLQEQLDAKGAELLEAQQLLAQGERYRQQLSLAMERLKGQDLHPEEASFVLSELSKSAEGFQILFEDAPEDCSSTCVARWHEAHGVAVPVSVEVRRDRRHSSVLCRYAQEAEAQEALRQLQDSVLTSRSGQSVVRARMVKAKTSESWRKTTWDSQLRKDSKNDKNERRDEREERRHEEKREEKREPAAEKESKNSLNAQRISNLEAQLQGSQAESSTKAKRIEELTEENKKLKVCLEELQAKLRQLMHSSKERGFGEEISEIANDLGLKRVLSCPTRFDILYQDAFERIERLEELRRRVREERRCAAEPAAAPAEPSVLSLVERSPLVILQQLLSTGPVGWSLTSSSPKRTRPRHLEPEQPEPRLVLAESASAPNLRTPKGWDKVRRVGLPRVKQMDRVLF